MSEGSGCHGLKFSLTSGASWSSESCGREGRGPQGPGGWGSWRGQGQLHKQSSPRCIKHRASARTPHTVLDLSLPPAQNNQRPVFCSTTKAGRFHRAAA